MNRVMMVLGACVLSATTVAAEAPKVDPRAGEPVGERLSLWPKGQVPDMEEHQYNEPFIEWFVPSNKTTDAVMILSCGGGYNICAWNPEGQGSSMYCVKGESEKLCLEEVFE